MEGAPINQIPWAAIVAAIGIVTAVSGAGFYMAVERSERQALTNRVDQYISDENNKITGIQNSINQQWQALGKGVEKLDGIVEKITVEGTRQITIVTERQIVMARQIEEVSKSLSEVSKHVHANALLIERLNRHPIHQPGHGARPSDN